MTLKYEQKNIQDLEKKSTPLWSLRLPFLDNKKFNT